jgi:hypothetical protein
MNVYIHLAICIVLGAFHCNLKAETIVEQGESNLSRGWQRRPADEESLVQGHQNRDCRSHHSVWNVFS